MKKFAVLLLAGVMAFSSLTVRAAETGTTQNSGFSLDLSSVTDLLNSDKLQSLSLDSFDVRKLDIDSLVQKARTSEYVKNLDVSKLNLGAAFGLLKDSEVLNTLGLEKVNMGELLSALKNETIVKKVLEWAASAAKGESIAESVKSFVKTDAIRAIITKIIDGKDPAAVLKGLDSKNMKPLLQKGLTALFSEQQLPAEGTELTEEEQQDADIAEAAGTLLSDSLKALLGN